MKESVLDFYGALASDYHLISVNWEEAIAWQGNAIDSLIRRFDSRQGLSVLDCSCGIGTQAIALALKDYDVTATDISRESVDRAKQEASRLGAKIEFDVVDLRFLSAHVSGFFDVVLTFDNSVAHLHTEQDLEKAAASLFAKVKQGGRLFLSLRDYDTLRKEKPTGTLPRHFNDEHGERVIVQNWEWSNDFSKYDMTLFLLEKTKTNWNVKTYQTKFRAWLRHEIEEALRGAGFQQTRWLETADTSYYQPILTAKK